MIRRRATTDDLAGIGRGDPDEFLEPDFLGMPEGVPPMLIQVGSSQDAVSRLVNDIATAVGTSALSLSNLLVIYGNTCSKRHLYNQLSTRFGDDSIWWFAKDGQKGFQPETKTKDYPRLAYLDAATGLEAPVVFLIGIDDNLAVMEEPDDGDELSTLVRQQAARKFYMAMTRAGQRLILLATGQIPGMVADAFSRFT